MLNEILCLFWVIIEANFWCSNLANHMVSSCNNFLILETGNKFLILISGIITEISNDHLPVLLHSFSVFRFGDVVGDNMPEK